MRHWGVVGPGGDAVEFGRVIRLAEGLLLFSRVRSGQRASRKPVDLKRLLLEVFDVAARLAEG